MALCGAQAGPARPIASPGYEEEARGVLGRLLRRESAFLTRTRAGIPTTARPAFPFGGMTRPPVLAYASGGARFGSRGGRERHCSLGLDERRQGRLTDRLP